jgi:NAD(P)-dependent dehydrogenase (short-subunit alcohol dehydrogenase family)
MSKPEVDRIRQLFDLSSRVAIITGGAGLLGYQHADVLAAVGAHVVLLDLASSDPAKAAAELTASHRVECIGLAADITDEASVIESSRRIMAKFGRIDVLINNAANNPKVEEAAKRAWSRLENLPVSVWDADVRVGLTGAFLCSRVFGAEMAKAGRGVIINVASDLALIAPDQRLYRVDGLPEDEQPVKPVTYSVVKSGLLGLTRYLATYWRGSNIRVNAICPGGVSNGQPEAFLNRLKQLIPMERMAGRSEYQGAILFLCSDASSYMTGANLVIDGGRTCW